MKTKRFNLGVKIASILSAVAILSVGFASWLIVNVPEDQQFDEIGSFTVYTVNDQSVSLSYDWNNDGTFGDTEGEYDNMKIVFGKPTTGNTDIGWLQADSSMIAESLTATAAVNVTNYAQLGSFTLTLGTGTNFNAALDSGYVKAPTVSAYLKGDSTNKTAVGSYSNGVYTFDLEKLAEDSTTDTAGDCTIVFEITFDWGSVTDNDNPYTFYSDKSYVDKVTEATAMLNAIAELESEKYTLTFDCVGNTN